MEYRTLDLAEKRLKAYFAKKYGEKCYPIDFGSETDENSICKLEENEFLIAFYEAKNIKLYFSNRRVIYKNDYIPFELIKSVFLNPRFKVETTSKELNILTINNLLYKISFDDIEVLSQVRNDARKIISCFIVNWVGIKYLVKENDIKNEIILL